MYSLMRHWQEKHINNQINNIDKDCIPFSLSGSKAPALCMVAPPSWLTVALNGTEASLMLLVTPVLTHAMENGLLLEEGAFNIISNGLLLCLYM